MIVDLTLAPLAVLAFLGMGVFIVAAAAVAVVAYFNGKKAMSALMMKVLISGVGIYFVAMLAASAFSKDYLLGRGAEKHFCEMDCHIAYSVVKVEQAWQSAGLAKAAPSERVYVVTLRTHFDEKTIGPNRGDGPLTPNPRRIYFRDDAGHEYAPSVTIAGTPLGTALRPGESYETTLTFSLPADAKEPRMFLTDDPWPNAFLIGHERSPLHGKAYFDLKR